MLRSSGFDAKGGEALKQLAEDIAGAGLTPPDEVLNASILSARRRAGCCEWMSCMPFSHVTVKDSP